ncbi:EAL domain-containing protein [Eubacteriaceae bacterium ES3]|nr:EAL domain-containing protein [Eubacteriaceae bacterium ES3]
MKEKKTIQNRLNYFILSIILCVIVFGCAMAIYIFFSIYENEVEKQIQTGVHYFEKIVVSENNEKIKNASENIGQILNSNSPDDAYNEISSYTSYEYNDDFAFFEIKKDNLLFYENVMCPPDVLLMTSNDLTKQNYQIVSWIDGNSKDGLYLFSQQRFEGIDASSQYLVTIGMPIDQEKIVDYIKNTSSLDATIFADNIRMVTTITQNNVSLSGTELDPDIYNILYHNGEEYFGKTEILDDPYLVGYIPIKNYNAQTVGALFVGKSMASIFHIRNQIMLAIIIFGLILISIFYLVSQKWLKRNITTPINGISEMMKTVSEGNYNSLDSLTKPSSREIEVLQNSMKSMVHQIIDNQENLRTAAYYDPITKLANRSYFYQKYHALTEADSTNYLSVLYYIDVDNLKYINNLFGHRMGDALLFQIAKTLESLIENKLDYSVYRIGGDEFVICKENKFLKEDVDIFSKFLIEAFKKPFQISNQSVIASVSIGISYTDSNTDELSEFSNSVVENNFETMLVKAEVAMNQVKANGKNNYMVFDPSMNKEMQRKAILEQDLKAALANNELSLYFQPKFSITAKRFEGFEALARWKHKVWGFISPMEFIKIAEESNLILELGKWILIESCRFITRFNDLNNTDYCIAVNISAIQLLDESFEALIIEMLENTKVKPNNLELEITESVLMNSLEIANQKLLFLREKQISIALDDFGTGFSSLTYLKILPITTVKLDKSFIDDIAFNPVSYQIVDNVTQIAKSIGLKIVVEGVETKEQLEILEKLECDFIQGYYFSKPVPENELLAVLEKKRS